MNTQIFNLETKINELVMRMNNAETSLKENATNEINSLRNELNDLINQFDELKIQMLSENSDEKLTEEIIEDLVRLIDSFVEEKGKRYFRDESFTSNQIDNCDLRINYSCEIEIESATINVGDYFCKNFSFKFEDFINYVDKAGLDEYQQLIKYLPEELFNLMVDIIEQSVSDVDNSPTFYNVEDFECEIMYSKKLEVTDITIQSSELQEKFDDEFEFPEGDIYTIIKSYHNFSDTYSSDDNSDDNSDEN